MQLAREQFSELNATLYQASPDQYFRMRLQSLSLLMSDSTVVDELLDQGMSQGVVSFGPTRRLDAETRRRYAAMESSILVHHAGETLIRLYLGHLGAPDCPWLEIARLRDYRRFKQRLAALCTQDMADWDRSDVGHVFLGGTSAVEAGIDLSSTDWESSIDGFVWLLRLTACRLLEESDLYNAAKHGLVGVSQGEASVEFEGVQFANGPSVVHLSTETAAGSGVSDADKWYANVAYIGLDSNLMVTEVQCRAISSIWAVARRRYVGAPGQLPLLGSREVLTAFFANHIARVRIADAIAYKLATKAPNTSGQMELQGRVMKAKVRRLDEEAIDAFESVRGRELGGHVVDLPLRESDQRGSPSRERYLFPFSPRGSQSVG